MFRAVEGHVFEEMRQAVLRILFLKGPHIVHNVEIRTSCRIGVVSDIVCQPVVKPAIYDLGVAGYGVCRADFPGFLRMQIPCLCPALRRQACYSH